MDTAAVDKMVKDLRALAKRWDDETSWYDIYFPDELRAVLKKHGA